MGELLKQKVSKEEFVKAFPDVVRELKSTKVWNRVSYHFPHVIDVESIERFK